MKISLKKSIKHKMKRNKTLFIIIGLILAAGGYLTYLCLNYFFYDTYKQYLTEAVYEDGSQFTPLTEDNSYVYGMVLAAENDILKLYTNIETTEIAVYDKRSNTITYSNPPDREKDILASGSNKTALNSQFVLSYYDSSMTEVTMYNYDYSVLKKQVTAEKIKDGIRYTYLCGNLDSPTGLVPPFITKERLEEKILSRLTEKEAKTFKNSYTESKTLEGFLELSTGVKGNKVGLSKLNKLVEAAGYTVEEFDADAQAASGDEAAERTTFTIPLEYRLEKDKLIVSVPTEQIQETGGGKLAKIDLLCFFGAGGTEEEGYMLVPNGSGSLIHFNNGKRTERYNQYIYGMDEAMQSFIVVENTEEARLPVFGIKRRDNAVFAIITEGDTLANLIADVSGGVNSYNYVYPSFLLRGTEKVSMFGTAGVSADLPVLEKDLYRLTITVGYSFLEKEDASYSGMATYYRTELMNRGLLSKKLPSEKIPFYLDVVGGVKQQMSILGVPYLGVYPMTTFEEAQDIVKTFQAESVNNLRINYLGWFNGGYYHDVAKDIKIEKKLGGKKELLKLKELLVNSGSKLFGDVAFQKVSFESDYYNYKMESSQYYSGYVISLGRKNPVTLRQTGSMGYQETNYNIVSPKFLVRHIDKFKKSLEEVPLDGISLRDMGEVLSSDKRRTNVINREEAKKIITSQLMLLQNSGKELMINSPNVYAFAYTKDIQNVPEGHNPYYIVDEEIPFYQMVIHGMTDYCGNPINLSDNFDKQQLVLRMLEYGLAPHFTLSYQDSSDIKYSGLNSLYSTQYDNWLKAGVAIYHQVNEVLQYVTGSTITEHEILDNGLRHISYENGCTLYINYSNKDKTHQGVNIPARDYVLKKGAKGHGY
ncbi:hypothetical protein acsn021_21110 [Anaerocolumna cellulosilytica]|uniref:Uncharacterized protein n=1 Tax=Anaerocolumna cellulosilytica TaxID=433286 RepID=A0A6S6R512_9FIRM|nr:DUF5696 domain-containing protein [Anaerocolumna cellulosilytica]MBB5194245.1 hypothetical protein [Anaerocolumna cellulosilytica]BCJ94542.1 hypothetical protein acsn021_21110 [Anaerocolumna cellulosilytica]